LAQAAIYLRFTLDYKRVELVTHLYLCSRSWNAQTQSAKENSEEGVEINRQLTIIKADLLRHYNRLKALDMEVTVEPLSGNWSEEKDATGITDLL
jgi:hypothetical protein